MQGQGAAVGFGDPPGDRQAEAGAQRRGAGVDLHEAIEDPVLVLLARCPLPWSVTANRHRFEP